MGDYSDLTEGEQAHWNEYTTYRAIKDWPGYDDLLESHRAKSRKWLDDRRAELWHDLNSEPIDRDANKKNKRQERYNFLVPDNLNRGAPKHEVRLPCSGSATDSEKVYIEVRECWAWVSSTTDEQKTRKQAITDALIEKRTKLWHLIQDDPNGNKPNDRQVRYDNLCIATRTGDAYEEWESTHNKWGVPYDTSVDRESCMDWCKTYLGVSENPANSNRGNPEPDGWEMRVFGSTGIPWCACFAVCSSWDNGVSGSGTAGCTNNADLAKQGKGIYRGYTTDTSKVQRGDHFFINGNHTGVIRSDNCNSNSVPSYEGNTSPGSEGSQYNGGTVAQRTRTVNNDGITGFGLVRFSD